MKTRQHEKTVRIRHLFSAFVFLNFFPVSLDAYARVDEVASQTFALVEELKQVRHRTALIVAWTAAESIFVQAVPVQLERSQRVKTVTEEIKSLKL